MRLTFHRLIQKDLRSALGYYDAAAGPQLVRRFYEEFEGLERRIMKTSRLFRPALLAHRGIRREKREVAEGNGLGHAETPARRTRPRGGRPFAPFGGQPQPGSDDSARRTQADAQLRSHAGKGFWRVCGFVPGVN